VLCFDSALYLRHALGYPIERVGAAPVIHLAHITTDAVNTRAKNQHEEELYVKLSYYAIRISDIYTIVTKAQQHANSEDECALVSNYHANRLALVRMDCILELDILASRYDPRSPKLSPRSRGRLGSRL
jgi:hypothetical protein